LINETNIEHVATNRYQFEILLLASQLEESHQWCHSYCFSTRSSVFFISSSVL